MEKNMKTTFDNDISCFGEYDPSDLICGDHCALRLRCAIEREQNLRMQIIDELASSEIFPTTVQ